MRNTDRGARSLLAGLLVLTGCSSSGGGVEGACAPSATWVFDSSFSDTGNAAAATFGLAVPQPPYFAGRFSNGPVTVEYLAAELGTEVVASADGGTNYAFGGARTSVPNFLVVPPIRDQVSRYLESADPDPEALYVMRVAANDLLLAVGGNGRIDLAQSVVDLAGMVDDLVAGGARHFLFFDLPDLPSFPPEGAALAGDFNAALRGYVDDLPDRLDAHVVDVFGIVEDMKANPAGFGLTNVDEACLDVDPPLGCDTSTLDPVADGYLLYDEAHLTTRMHEEIASEALRTLCGG